MADKYYAEIFNHNGASYHRAMELFPHARDEEFQAALGLLSLKANDHLLDVPSGGAYLKSYLPDGIIYQALDFSKGFNANDGIGECTETQIPIQDNSLDHIVSLAAMHHVDNKYGFLEELSRCLTPGGTLLIGDIVKGSKEALFLNGFVDRFNELGHDGDFIDFDRDCAMLNEIGFGTQYVTKHYHWNFQSESDCYDYLRLLFALNKQPTTSELNTAVTALGTKKTNSGFHLSWSLGFIVATWR